MTVIQQFFTPIVNKFGFQGLSSAGAERTAVPRQELFFIVEDGDVTAETAPDTVQTFVNCTLPFGFAYAITDITMSVFHDEPDKWVNSASATIRDSNQAESRTYTAHLEGRSTDDIPFPGGTPNNPDRTLKMWNWQTLPTWIIIPAEDSAAHISVTTANVPGDPGGTALAELNFLCRVIQFDVSQAHHFEVNTPLLVR